ncbi:hypothetical protein [Phenylobacterium sp.]|nr:hypothetical protein [Phenylobacterium sp.]HVI32278.1 hypothetical protein [Phenylobacterium sp.]
MKTRTPRAFQVVYRRRKVVHRPDTRPHRAVTAVRGEDLSGLILYGQG